MKQKKSKSLFQDGGEGNALNGKPLSSKNAQEDNGASWIRAAIPGTDTTAAISLITSPLYFVKSGRINEPAEGNSKLYVPGEGSRYWAATAWDINANGAFNASFNGVTIYPSAYGNRRHGFPLRCLHQS